MFQDGEVEETQEMFFLRLVPEGVLRATGRAADTGLHLVLYGPAAAGLDAWALGAAWGWTRAELEALQAAGEHLLAVLQAPGDRWGLASADALATLISAARPADVGYAEPDALLEAITCPPEESAARGLDQLRAEIAAVLDVPVGTLARIPRRGEEPGDLAFLLDEKIDDTADDGLARGSALKLADYPDLPTVIRLPWGKEA